MTKCGLAGVFVAGLALVAVPSLAVADNVGQCGWGSKLMEGNEGPAPQVLAVTTNGTSGNQTFGITSGTSGCTQDGVVRSNWKTAMFIDGNMNRLARDMSAGEGESLDSLATLLGMTAGDKAVFSVVAQKNFAAIFPTASVSSRDVVSSLKTVLASDARLVKYSEKM